MGMSKRAESATILVVDDEPIALEFCRSTLVRAGYNVLTASSGEQALNHFKSYRSPIDLALIDVVMPDLTGPDLAERILAIRPHLKVLFMSGCTESDVVRVKILDRALGFLPKPFTSDSLLERVQKVLNPPTRSASAGANYLSTWR